MPCYEPPPPYEGAARKSAEDAARLLCGFVSKEIKARRVPDIDLLLWWKEHRRIDAYIAEHDQDYQEKDQAIKDVGLVTILINEKYKLENLIREKCGTPPSRGLAGNNPDAVSG